MWAEAAWKLRVSTPLDSPFVAGGPEDGVLPLVGGVRQPIRSQRATPAGRAAAFAAVLHPNTPDKYKLYISYLETTCGSSGAVKTYSCMFLHASMNVS